MHEKLLCAFFAMALVILPVGGNVVAYASEMETSGYNGEGQFTSALVYLASESLPIIYTIEGHDETDVDSTFTSSLRKMNVTVESLTLLEVDAVPDDAKAIIINAPTSDFSDDDAQKVIDYLDAGGKALITTTFEAMGNMKNFNSVLAEFNLEVKPGLVVENDKSMYYQYAYYLLPDVCSADETAGVDGYIFAPYAQAIATTVESDELTYQSLLTTSEDAYVKADVANSNTLSQKADDESGQFDVAANVANSSTGGEITVVTSPYVFTDEADEIVSGNNLDLFNGIMKQLIAENGAADNAEGKSDTTLKTQKIIIKKSQLTKMIKYKKLKKKNRTFKLKASTSGNGKITYKKTSGNKKIKVSKIGKVTVKKGLKKGKTYKVKVKVTAAKTSTYKKATKTVTLKIKIK